MFNKSHLKKNSRFDCLSSSKTPQNNRPEEEYSRTRRSRIGDRYSNSKTDKFSFLKNREKRAPKINLSEEMTTGKFPSLVKIKNDHEMSKSDTKDYLNIVNNPDNDDDKKNKVMESKDKPKVGWVFIRSDKANTKMNTIDEDGNEIQVEKNALHDDPSKDNLTREEYQRECAIVSYSILKETQCKRDEEIEALGAKSNYYGKGSLTDLSYLSLSDEEFESSESDNDEYRNYDDCSDDDTY